MGFTAQELEICFHMSLKLHKERCLKKKNKIDPVT